MSVFYENQSLRESVAAYFPHNGADLLGQGVLHFQLFLDAISRAQTSAGISSFSSNM